MTERKEKKKEGKRGRNEEPCDVDEIKQAD